MAKKVKGKDINQIMYISIGCAIAGIIICIVLFMVFNKKDTQKIDLEIGNNTNNTENASEQASTNIGKKVDELENYEELDETQSVQVGNSENVQLQQVAENNSQSTNNQEAEGTDNKQQNLVDNTTTQPEEPVKDPTFVMPVEGEVLKLYGKEKLIYSDTLKEWTTHLGIDIKADKTTIVKSSSEGTIKSIKNDPRYGLTVVIEHENGFSSVYSNLLTAEFVVVGEKVESGQTIGTVGNSATFEILDEPHLHFEILKDGNSVDPQMYIK